MSWLRKIFIGLIVLVCLFVTADYLFDRTQFVNQQVKDALATLPMKLRVDKVKHRVTQLGELELQGVSWQDEFGDSIAIDKLTLKFNWRALLHKTLDIELLAIDGISFKGSQYGLQQLQTELTANKTQDTVEPAPSTDISDYLPTKLVVDTLALSQINLDFATEHQQLALQQFNLEVTDTELTDLMQFDPVNLSLAAKLGFEHLAFSDSQQQQALKLGPVSFAVQLAPELNIKHSDLFVKNVSFSQPSLTSSIEHISLQGAFLANWLNKSASIDAFNWQTSQAKLTSKVDKIEVQLPQQAHNSQYSLEQLKLSSQLVEQQFHLENLSFDTFGGQVHMQAQSNLTLPLDVRLQQLNLTNLTLQHLMAKPTEQSAEDQQQVSEALEQTEQTEQASGQSQQIEQIAQLHLEQVNLKNINAKLIEPQTAVGTGDQLLTPWFLVDKFNLTLADIGLIQQHKLVDLVSLNTGAEIKLSARQLSYQPKDQSSQFEHISLNVKQTDSALQLTDTGLTHKDGRVQTQGFIFDKRRLGETTAVVNLETDIYKFDLAALEPFLQDSAFKPKGQFDATFDADLQLKPNEQWLMQQGDVKIKSGPFKVEGIAMDKLINGFKASQETSLLDIGSFLVAGPMGMMAMQFVELTAGAAQYKGNSQIKSIEANAHVQNNQVKLNRAKLKTAENNLGFIGNIDLTNKAFKQFKFAILDDKDCPSIQQTLNGKFSEVKKVLFNTTSGAVTSPLSNVWRKAKDATTGGCKSFFSQ